MGSNPTLNMRADLSDYAHMVAGDAAKILRLANILAPVVECGSAMLVQYATFNTDNAFMTYAAQRGVGGKARRINFAGSSSTADLSPNALEIGLDTQERDRAGASANTLEQSKVKTLVHSAYNSHCKAVVTAMQAGVSAAAGKGVWSNANTDPIDEIDEQLEAIARYVTPTHIVMDVGAWRKAKNHPKVKARFTAKGFNLADFAGALLIPSVNIELTDVSFGAYGFDNASGPSNTAAIGTECLILVSAPAPTPFDPSAMKTFATRADLFEGVSDYFEEQTRSTIFSIDWTAVPKVISTSLVKRLTIT